MAAQEKIGGRADCVPRLRLFPRIAPQHRHGIVSFLLVPLARNRMGAKKPPGGWYCQGALKEAAV
jgi:hypothetical protein